MDDLKRAELLSAARKAVANAYAPYSRFAVGAAVLADDGSIISGCNVENVSYGLTICAERAAIFNAISQGKKKISAIAITNSAGTESSPCGACRQVIYEFSTPDTEVIIDMPGGKTRIASIHDLLPKAFGPRDLPRS